MVKRQFWTAFSLTLAVYLLGIAAAVWVIEPPEAPAAEPVREAVEYSPDPEEDLILLGVMEGEEPVVLPAREWQLRPAAAYSRQWEYRRLWALYRLAQEKPRVIVATAAAMAQLCLPAAVLQKTAFTLEVGQQYDVTALTAQLTAAGYVRAQQVEGAGQFALRGGILDIFSPGPERPVRCEFFDDELDSMGDFDVTTQRRVENRQRFTVLPAGEVLPFYNENAAESAAKRIDAAAKRLAKKENAAALRQRLEEDAQSLRQGVTPPGGDRYLAAVYPDAATAFDGCRRH